MISYNTPEFISYKLILFEVVALSFDIINHDFKSGVYDFIS